MARSTTVQKRSLRRSRIFLPAMIESGCGRDAAIVRDISALGALLEVSVAPPVGSTVRLTYGKTSVEGRVAWSDSTWLGVEFSKPLKRGDLFEQTNQLLKVSAPRVYRRETVQDIGSSSQSR